MNKQTIIRTAGGLTLAAGLALGAALPASASHGGGGKGVQAHGACSLSGTWKLKAKGDDGRIEVQAEVETQQANGLSYAWTITDNGTVAAQGTSTTQGREGSFGVRGKIANQAGTDVLAFTATNTDTGNTCSGTVSL